MPDTYKPFTVNETSESGHKITGPFTAVRMPHWPRKTRWALCGRRADVSAVVLEPATAIRFRNRKNALGFLALCSNV